MSVLGMLNNDSWVTDERPKSWRAGILRSPLRGTVPLTAFTSRMKQVKVDDPEFNWWTKGITNRRATVTTVYTDAAMTNVYTGSDGVAGDTIYIKMSAADVAFFRAGNIVRLVDKSNTTNNHVGKVTGTLSNGAASRLTISMLEDDDNGGSDNWDNSDGVVEIGTAHAEGAERPTAIAFQATKFTNKTQIFRDPVQLTRTAMRTRLRTTDQLTELKREALERHMISIEKAFLFGIQSEGTGANGTPERTTDGFYNFILTNASANVSDFTTSDTNYDNTAWTASTGGIAWLEEFFELAFREGNTDERWLYCGSGALQGLIALQRANQTINLEVQDIVGGLDVRRWITPFGKVNIVHHPLMTAEITTRNSAFLLDPRNVVYNYIDDTFYKPDKAWREGGSDGVDGIREEWLTECGLEFHHPQQGLWLDGFNQDNPA